MCETLSLPLAGVRVVEFEGLGPGPMAGRILADMGAEVVLIARAGVMGPSERLTGVPAFMLEAGKQREEIDLKSATGQAQALALIATADVLIEGFRPGVMERLGLGPAECAKVNPRLVYGRMTGWGQSGPLADAAGHELNYLALTGLLPLIARDGATPVLPPALMGDATGALGLAFGILAALLAVRAGGPGRVVDAAIIDVVSMLGTLFQWLRAGNMVATDLSHPFHNSPFHDSPFYDVYRCADGFISIAPLEPQFWQHLLESLGLTDINPADQYDKTQWPALKSRLAALFATRSRADWSALLEGADVCFAAVLNLEEAAQHPHFIARGIYAPRPDGSAAPAPAPRFLPLVVGNPPVFNGAFE